MNDEMKNTNPNGIEKKLLDVAGRTNADPHFVSELEAKLKDIHKPKTSWSMPMFKQTSAALGWVALVAVLGYFLNWSFATLIPTQQPGANTTTNQFVCPVTEPNGSTPPFEQPSAYYHGNSELWTALWPDGKIYMLPTDKMPDGSFSMKWGFWRGAEGGVLTVEGHRLDADAAPLRADIPDGYGDTGFQVLALIFPTTGCWEVTGRVGESSLTFVTDVVFGEATPTPNVSTTQNTTSSVNATPAPDGEGGYAWRDTKMYLAQPLPQSPTDAQVYSLKINQPVTQEDVLALAQRFALQGDVQELPPDFSNGIDYMLTDGTQKLEVQSNNRFVFYPNHTAATLGTIPEEQARTAIDSFLKKYGFNFEYRVESAPGVSAQQYDILPLAPDGIEIRTDYLMPINYQVTIDGTGQILAFSGFLLDYETLGTYPIITAEEAFQDAIADHPQFGHMESMRGKNGGGGGGGPGFYKLNLSGTPVPFPTAITQSNGIQDSIEYIVKEGDTLFAIAQAYGITPEKIFEANGFSDGDVLMPGMTLIIPSSAGYAYIVVAGDTCRSIASTFNISVDDLITNNNLPADCSTLAIDQVLMIPAPQSSSDNPYIGKRFEDQRGIFIANIYRKPDGNQRTEYSFITKKDNRFYNFLLTGDGLQELEKYHNRPANIWGTVEQVDQNGQMILRVEKYEVPFPNLQIQLFQGTQENTSIDGQTVTMFTTTDGQKYILLFPIGDLDQTTVDPEKPLLLLEAMAIPGESFEGYPTLRYFNGGLAVDPMTNKPAEFPITADKPNILDEVLNVENYVPPTATIEKVELVYYLPNLQSGNANPSADAKYIQPTWRFYGHYSTGDEFEILIQALQQEFLLPQLAPYTSPG